MCRSESYGCGALLILNDCGAVSLGAGERRARRRRRRRQMDRKGSRVHVLGKELAAKQAGTTATGGTHQLKRAGAGCCESVAWAEYGLGGNVWEKTAVPTAKSGQAVFSWGSRVERTLSWLATDEALGAFPGCRRLLPTSARHTPTASPGTTPPTYQFRLRHRIRKTSTVHLQASCASRAYVLPSLASSVSRSSGGGGSAWCRLWRHLLALSGPDVYVVTETSVDVLVILICSLAG